MHVLHNTGLQWVPHTQRHSGGYSTAPVHPAPHSNDPDHMMDMAVWSLQCMNRDMQCDTGQCRFSANQLLTCLTVERIWAPTVGWVTASTVQ